MKFNDNPKNKHEPEKKTQKNEDGVILHTIKNRETLDSIMEQYNVSFDDLKGLNRIGNITNIKIGGIIRIK